MTVHRIRTSEPAYRAPISQWQAERARGTLHAIDQHGRPWTYARLVGEALLVFAFGAVFAVLVML